MKKIICIILSVIVLVFPGCQKKNNSISLHFYYPRANYGYNPQDGRFFLDSAALEIREDIVYQSARQVLGEYLKGPVDPALSNPFPADVTLISLNIDGSILYLTLSDHLADLTGIPLTMACACLAKTGTELTRATTVQIKCQSALLDGKKNITFTADTVVFNDPVVPTETQ